MVRPNSAALSAGTSAVLGREQPAAAGRMVPGVPRKAVMWRTDRRKMGADCLSYLKQTRSKPMSVSASDGAEKLSTLAQAVERTAPMQPGAVEFGVERRPRESDAPSATTRLLLRSSRAR
jgi:hypothetical protein